MWDGNSVPICRVSDSKVDGADHVAHSRVCRCVGEGFGAWVVSLRQGRAINDGNRHEC
jgi:hypothetical protein